MPDFGPGAAFTGIAETLARLLAKPGTSAMGNNLMHQLPQISGPFGVSPSSGTYHSNGTNGASAAGQGIGNVLAGLGKSYSGIGAHLGSLVGALNQPSDPMQTLYQQLLDQLQSPVNSPTGIDTQDLMKQVQDALNPLYDQRIHQAQDQTKRDTKDVQGMYGALSNDYKQLAPEQIAQAADAQKQIEGMYGQLRSNIEGSYSRVSNEQADLFKQLGIQDALPAVLDKQQAPVQDALTAASENQTQQQQRYMDIGQMDSTYYREGAPNAVLTGNEVSGNLISQLQDYVNKTNAERSTGIQSAYMDQLGQAQNMLLQQQNQAQSQTTHNQDMLFQLLQGQMNQKQAAATPDTFMAQLPPQIQQQVGAAFTQLQRSPEAVYGKVQDPRNPVPGTFVDTTSNWYAAQADKMYQSGQIDAATYQALLQYLQLQNGK
jgi:hypothetical protein